MKLEELVARLHEALIDDPRGCEHPRFMKPQCERLAAAISESIPEEDPWDGAHLVECGPRCRKDHRKASQEADLAVE